MAHISIRNASLTYPIYTGEGRSVRSTLSSRLGGKIGSTGSGARVVKALSNVSLEIKSGDRIGIIGHNGAGKSTFLKVLSRIYHPQEGEIEIEGSVSCLVDITLGMDTEANGWDNIKLRGTFLGLTAAEIKKLTPDIAEFSELGEFMDMPLRTYSSGMFMRLAFAITTSVQPEILVMDEMIGAGDAAFLDKALARVEAMIGKTEIMVVATHSNFIIRKFCNKVLWLEIGCVRDFGPVDGIIKYFETEGKGSLAI